MKTFTHDGKLYSEVRAGLWTYAGLIIRFEDSASNEKIVEGFSRRERELTTMAKPKRKSFNYQLNLA